MSVRVGGAEVLDVRAAPWEEHPRAKGLARKTLLEGPGISCFLVRAEDGADVAEHVHEDAEDIAYVLSGRAVLRIGGEVVELRAGMLVRIPRGIPHQILDCREGFCVLNLFLPSC